MRCVQTTRLTCMIELFQNKKWQKKMMMMTQVNQNYYLLRATSKLYWSPTREQGRQKKEEVISSCDFLQMPNTSLVIHHKWQCIQWRQPEHSRLCLLAVTAVPQVPHGKRGASWNYKAGWPNDLNLGFDFKLAGNNTVIYVHRSGLWSQFTQGKRGGGERRVVSWRVSVFKDYKRCYTCHNRYS